MDPYLFKIYSQIARSDVLTGGTDPWGLDDLSVDPGSLLYSLPRLVGRLTTESIGLGTRGFTPGLSPTVATSFLRGGDAPTEAINTLEDQVIQSSRVKAEVIEQEVFAESKKKSSKIKFRSIDGQDNNKKYSQWGASGTQLLRIAGPSYQDGTAEPRGGLASSLPSPREISNAISDFTPTDHGEGIATDEQGNPYQYTDWLWQWGQFIDHDIALTESAFPAEPFLINVPPGDPYFDPAATGDVTISLNRSIYDPTTGTDPSNSRQQINEITAYLDASMVYGSDLDTAHRLRAWDGKGRLLSGVAANGEAILAFDTVTPGSGLFMAGDIRANEQIGLTAVHTLFVREHNRIAEDIWSVLNQLTTSNNQKKMDKAEKKAFKQFEKQYKDLEKLYSKSSLSMEDFIYESARRIVGAEIQAITYNEFLPLLIGKETLPAYNGYDSKVNPGITNEFSTAAYRVGHTMLSPQLLRVQQDGSVDAIDLKDSFFSPDIISTGGIDGLLLGLASQQAQAVDTFIISDVRNFLFGPPGAGGFDLASLNIQRGRDHGLPSLNVVRQQMGLEPYASFDELTGCEIIDDHEAGDVACELASRFESVYDSIDDVDLWVGGLAEPHRAGATVGQTFQAILADQFTRLRDGDRFWYENDPVMKPLSVFMDPDITLADVIRANSTVSGIQDQAFFMADAGI